MNSVKVQEWRAGSGGEAWSFEPRAEGGITNIIVRHSEVVDAVSFVARTPDGRVQTSPRFGGPGGNLQEVALDWPREYITTISGTYDHYFDVPDVIRSMEFTTNHGRKLGTFGRPRGTAFALTIEEGAIVGFHGRSGQYLNSIGVFVRP